MHTISSIIVVAALSLSTVACTAPTSEDDDASASATRSDGTCAAPEGSYLIQMTERAGGTCGDIGEVITVVGADANAGTIDIDECENHTTWSENGCRLTLDYACPTSPGVVTSQRGTLTWNASATRASGVVAFTVSGRGIYCSSTYNATWSRQ